MYNFNNNLNENFKGYYFGNNTNLDCLITIKCWLAGSFLEFWQIQIRIPLLTVFKVNLHYYYCLH